jgi:hypothetical protein
VPHLDTHTIALQLRRGSAQVSEGDVTAIKGVTLWNLWVYLLDISWLSGALLFPSQG